MIEYMEGLLEQVGQEARVLALAEDMLSKAATTPHEILAIQTAVLRARATSRQFDLAIPPGNIAYDLSKELGEWDYFGTVCLFLGTSYGHVGKYAEGCHCFQEYLRKINLLDKAARYQSNVWFNLGIFYQDLGDVREASRAFVMAAKTSSMMKNDRYEHGVRQALIGQLLLAGELDQIPRLVVACDQYLRINDGAQNRSSRLYQIEARVMFAWKTMRRDRARALAGQGFSKATGDYLRLGKLHMLNAHIAWEADCLDEASDHAMTAKYYARRLNHSSLENEATRLLYNTVLLDQDEPSSVPGMETKT